MKVTRRRILIAGWLVGLLVPTLWAIRLFFGQPALVAVSEETTFLTGETLADGSLDFSMALRERCNTPVADSQNAGAALSQLPVPPSVRQAVYHRSEHPWDSVDHPVLREISAYERTYIRLWTEAVSKPRLIKPDGVLLRELTTSLQVGSNVVLRRAMLELRAGRSQEVVNYFKAADRASELLAELQCGWEINAACRIREAVSTAATNAILDSRIVNPELAAYMRDRARWPVHDVVAEAADNAVRIRFQTEVRDIRDDSRKLRAIVAAGLIGKDSTSRDLQLSQIRNSIDWTTVARIQNETVSSFVDALCQKSPQTFQLDWRSAQAELFRKKQAGNLVDSIRSVDMSGLSQQVAYALAVRSFRNRMEPLKRARQVLEKHRQMSLAGLALAQFREEHGTFPDTLSQLPGRWHSAVLQHHESGRPMEYERRGEGFWCGLGNSQWFVHVPTDVNTPGSAESNTD